MSSYSDRSYSSFTVSQHMEMPPPFIGSAKEKCTRVGTSARNVFALGGTFVFCLLSIVPILNAVSLLEDFSYVFWMGRSQPLFIILCIFVGASGYGMAIFLFFGFSKSSVQTHQTVMMMTSVFITLFGVILMVAAMPLSIQAASAYSDIMHRCEFSDLTHRLYEYSQVLHNIRRQPDCQSKASVELCEGFQDAPPYTTYLKTMETEYACAGFCYRSLSTLALTKSKLADNNGVLSKYAVTEEQNLRMITAAQSETAAKDYPPTLFSNSNFKSSCDGMAARDMKSFSGDIGLQTFYQGVCLVLVAAIAGCLKLVGFCARKDADFNGEPTEGDMPNNRPL